MKFYSLFSLLLLLPGSLAMAQQAAPQNQPISEMETKEAPAKFTSRVNLEGNVLLSGARQTSGSRKFNTLAQRPPGPVGRSVRPVVDSTCRRSLIRARDYLKGVCVPRFDPTMKNILTWTLLLTAVCTFPASAGNQILLRNTSPADGRPQVLAADLSGHVFVISALQSASGQFSSRVVELDLAGSRLASMDIAQVGLPTAAVTDAQGNLIVAGQVVSSAGLLLSGGVVVK